MEPKKKVILLAGPTSSGKSKLAIKLAKKFNGEIINADSMQIYKEISILTSKPASRDIKTVKHHLYGFRSVKEIFSTGVWLDMALKKIEKNFKEKKLPFVVGGTGLYFKALIDGLAKIPNIPKETRIEVRKLHEELDQKEFYNKLIQLDPQAKKFILPTDSQRSMRAYEVKKHTNKSLLDYAKETKSNLNNCSFIKIFIDTPKEMLSQNIEKRVEEMFNAGVIEEVKNFLKIKVDENLPSNKIIGIKEISNYLSKKITKDKTKELIKLKTRQYAKRQFTWARGQMKSWNMIYSSDFEDLFNKAAKKIS